MKATMRTRLMMATISKISKIATISTMLSIGAARADEIVVKPPAEQLSYRPNNLDKLPKDWITTYPIQLDIAFNLKYAPDSPEAEDFLETWFRTLHALPDHIRLEVLRMVAPTKYQYQVSLRFNNWREYRIYEGGRGMLDYYYAKWKPFVLDSEERLSVVDPVTTR
jgi:hypothetical protein